MSTTRGKNPAETQSDDSKEISTGDVKPSGSRPSSGRRKPKQDHVDEAKGAANQPKPARAPPKDRTPLGMKSWKTELNIIKDASLGALAEWWKTTQPKRIIVMTGAGISTGAGIPDFRSPGTGLYSNLQKYDLPTPESIFEINYFRDRPEAFFTLAKELYPGQFKPTVSHYFIKMLQQKGVLLRNYTQNIDTLERVAGIPGDKLVEAHGSFASARCVGGFYDPSAKPTPPTPKKRPTSSRSRRSSGTRSLIDQLLGLSLDDPEEDPRKRRPGCGLRYSPEWVRTRVFADQVPVCTGCEGLVKPEIVFFGESLPERFHTLLKDDFPICDLLIVMGTSLQVAPFNSLINFVGSKVPRLLINREEVGTHKSFGGGFDFTGEHQEFRRDAIHLSTIDEGVRDLARLLGWEDELVRLYEDEHKKIEEEWKAGRRGVVFEQSVGEFVDKAQEDGITDEKEKGSPVTPEQETFHDAKEAQTSLPTTDVVDVAVANLSTKDGSPTPPAAFVVTPPRTEIVTAGGVVLDLDVEAEKFEGTLTQLDEEEQAVVDALRKLKMDDGLGGPSAN
ncbi:SIR2-domain-containing protein [Gonapodya prolifera JEL478]|uniref:SIR2-domain-containing protein n=1 Tax=Gonapodya prolifera (strain JEL478) TaxID=1344416 RepID=A0A139ACK2_GONPJ|nr:SIR2-domain-containing protein [Gonapodya prolifera JEL478]|eukprot:KXS14399.1 SIR2-domain-containing protein [Gonapodya prolifera JEL478]